MLIDVVRIRKPKVYSSGNFEAFKDYVKEKVLKEKQAVSMKTLYEIYGLNVTDVRYRAKLKTRLEKEFETEITFLIRGTLF